MKTDQDFSIEEGQDKDVLVTLTNEDTGLPLNITGASFTWAAALSPHGAIYATKSTGSGITVTQNDVVATVIKISLANTDFPNGSAAAYDHYLRMTVAGKITPLSKGALTVNPEPFT